MRACQFLLLFSILHFSCAKKYTPFITQAPPITPLIIEKVPLSYVGNPPIIVSNNIIVTQSISSQLFKIGVPDCIDKTGGLAESYIIPLAEKLNTALSQTKRFELLDKGEILAIEKLSLKKDVFSYQNVNDSGKVDKSTGLLILKHNEKIKSEEEYKDLIMKLKDRCDGVLIVNISSVFNINNNGEFNKSMTAECKIMSTSVNNPNVILWARSLNIRFYADKKTESLKISDEDIQKIAEDIKASFPNPDLQQDLKITAVKDQVITVNAGKNDNINKGMFGYVVKMNEDKKSYQFRVLFEVTEVFPDAFNAILITRDNYRELDALMIKQVVVSDPVRMK